MDKIKIALNPNYKPLINKSLILFDKNNQIRKFCWNIIINKMWFEYTIRIMIVLSLVVFAIERPNLKDKNVLLFVFYFEIVKFFLKKDNYLIFLI